MYHVYHVYQPYLWKTLVCLRPQSREVGPARLETLENCDKTSSSHKFLLDAHTPYIEVGKG